MTLKEKLQPITVEEYLEGEKRSDVHHEYIAGTVYAMAGASGTPYFLPFQKGG